MSSYPWLNNLEVAKQRISELAAAGQRVNARAMQRTPGEAAYLYFHVTHDLKQPWQDLLDELGLSNQVRRRRYQWLGNLSAVAARVSELKDQGKDVSCTGMGQGSKEQKALVAHVRYKRWTWRKVLEQANSLEAQQRAEYPWAGDIEKIKQRVVHFRRQGVSVNHHAMKHARDERAALLYHVVEKHKIAWRDFLKELGIPSKSPRRDYPWRNRGWRGLLARIKQLHQQGRSLAHTRRTRKGTEQAALYLDAVRRFKRRWPETLAEAGINPFNVLRSIPKTPFMVTFAIGLVAQELENEKTPTQIRRERPKLYRFFRRIKENGTSFCGHSAWNPLLVSPEIQSMRTRLKLKRGFRELPKDQFVEGLARLFRPKRERKTP